jgi:3-oxoacid CoA-transferase subunit A
VITCGGFGLVGMPENIIRAIKHHGQKKLTWISDDANNNEEGCGELLDNNQLDKFIGSFIGPCKKMLKAHAEG